MMISATVGVCLGSSSFFPLAEVQALCLHIMDECGETLGGAGAR